MDLDRFLDAHAATWDRLDELLRRSGRRTRRLTTSELDELIGLYQLVSTHLSYATTNFASPGLNARLSRLVAEARSVVYGTAPRTTRGLARFFTITLPAALWHQRRPILVSAFLLLAPAVALGAWLATSPRAVDAAAPAAVRQAYVQHDFSAYYRSAPAAQFATTVYTHNAEVAAAAFVTGIALCLPTALLLMQNGANVGVAAGLFTSSGHTAEFWGLVVPHGLIELTSVAIAGGAGLRLGWTVIDPGDRTRRDALAEEAGRAVVLVLGTVLTLAVAGTIEGFVTGSGLPTALRVGIGAAAETAFLTYALVLGRRASRAGYTGRLGEEPV